MSVAANRVVLVDYDPQWALEFVALAEVLGRYLEQLPVQLEHVGSTSVPSLIAKPILDIDIVLPGENLLPVVTARLESAGYIPEGDLGVPGRYSFKRSGVDVPRTPTRALWPRHHLYAGAVDVPGISHHLIFRDALRRDRQLAAQYGELKQMLAARYPEDVDAYCEAKTEFIRNAVSGALSGV
jgi:GrpB-like predicted nucleotidyltransferase (UPF0157 family)